MTQGSFDHVFKLIVGDEGGFVNDPDDRGGATKYGITEKVLAAWRGKDVTVDDVRALGVDEAKLIFKAQYWQRIQGDRLPAGVDYAVADIAFNSGTGRAAEILQRALGVAVDRAIGEVTIDAADAAEPNGLIARICDQRLAFLKTTYGWSKYGKGWSARVARVRMAATALISLPPDVVSKTAIPPMEGTPADHAQKATRTGSGQMKILTFVGAAGTGAADAAQQIAPLQDYLPMLKNVFIALTLVSIVAGFVMQVQKLNEEAPQ